jgi:transcriptional regulator with XRE-family HTH domain
MLGTTIREARTARGMSLRQVSAATGVTPGGLSLIETGKCSPSVRTLEALAAALRVRFTVTPQGVGWERTR